MSKIYLSGNRVANVSMQEAERIEKEWSSKSEFIKIDDGTTVKNREIKRIEKQKEAAKQGYDLSNPADKQTILEFERFCEDLKTNTVKMNPIEHYGHPFKDQEKFPGYVTNELLGGVHWSLVHWALKERTISRREAVGISWAIVSQSLNPRTIDVRGYEELTGKLKALMNLYDRRNYAQQKDRERQDILVEKELFIKSTEMPKVEDELPF